MGHDCGCRPFRFSPEEAARWYGRIKRHSVQFCSFLHPAAGRPGERRRFADLDTAVKLIGRCFDHLADLFNSLFVSGRWLERNLEDLWIVGEDEGCGDATILDAKSYCDLVEGYHGVWVLGVGHGAILETGINYPAIPN